MTAVLDTNPTARRKNRVRRSFAVARTLAPSPSELAAAVLSAALLILSFPDFDLWPLAWVWLVPLFVAIVRRESHPLTAFLFGWIAGTLFFYGSCYWLTYSMIHYGGLPAWLAYPLLAPGAAIVGLFPGCALSLLAYLLRRRGAHHHMLFAAPFIWTTFELARLHITGQLWNALGYSQSYVPHLIGAARWGGVYAVSFAIVAFNAAAAYLLIKRTKRALIISSLTALGIASVVALADVGFTARDKSSQPSALVVGVQANVPIVFAHTSEGMREQLARHMRLSEEALGEIGDGRFAALPRIVVWSESSMSFAYTRDAAFREAIADFTRRNRTALIINSIEPATTSGGEQEGVHNSAIMVDKEGRLISQYDKIRLLPFGEYVPLPRWMPGAAMVSAIVGDFTPGERYPLLPFGDARAGIFICFESAFPDVARNFAAQGADLFINISNDGYLGPTPVRRQHLANSVFRAIENARPLLRVTNTGISAHITPTGRVLDQTASFVPAVRTWVVGRATNAQTFYTSYGDLFAAACVVITIFLFAANLFIVRRRAQSNRMI